MEFNKTINEHNYKCIDNVECICSFSSLPLSAGDLNAIVLINNRGRNKSYLENDIRFPMIEHECS